MEIIPSILTNNPVEAKELLSRCEDAARLTESELVNRISIDIIDGKFVDNKTIDPLVLKDQDITLMLDYQLMVNEPINWVQKCIDGGADRIIGHIEKMTSQFEFVTNVEKMGYKVGLGLDIGSDIRLVEEDVVQSLDVILLMSYPAGFGGQKLRNEVLEKVKQLNEIRKTDSLKYKIHVDGGITSDTINDVAKAGADEVSVGRRIFDGNLITNIKNLLLKIRN